MNRNFLLLTGLLICCCDPTNDFIVRTMRGGGFPSFNFGSRQHTAGTNSPGRLRAAAKPAKTTLTPRRQRRGSHKPEARGKARPHCRPSQRAHSSYWRPSRSPSGKNTKSNGCVRSMRKPTPGCTNSANSSPQAASATKRPPGNSPRPIPSKTNTCVTTCNAARSTSIN